MGNENKWNRIDCKKPESTEQVGSQDAPKFRARSHICYFEDFIRTNPELFDGTMEHAEAGIRAMRQWQTGKRKRPVTQWKGWELLDVRKQGV